MRFFLTYSSSDLKAFRNNKARDPSLERKDQSRFQLFICIIYLTIIKFSETVSYMNKYNTNNRTMNFLFKVIIFVTKRKKE